MNKFYALLLNRGLLHLQAMSDAFTCLGSEKGRYL